MPTAPFAFISRTQRALLGLGHRRVGREEDVRKDARRGDLVLLAALLLADAPLDAVAATGIADRRDAVAHPQFVDVLGRHALLFPADVAVHVDEARHHIVAAQVDLASAGRELRPLRLFLVPAGRADRHDLHDAIALDDDVGRAERRRAVPLITVALRRMSCE